MSQPALKLAPPCRSPEVPPLWGDGWRGFRKNRLAMAGLGMIVFFILLAVLAPWLAPYDYKEQELVEPVCIPGQRALVRDRRSRTGYFLPDHLRNPDIPMGRHQLRDGIDSGGHDARHHRRIALRPLAGYAHLSAVRYSACFSRHSARDCDRGGARALSAECSACNQRW